MCLSYVYDWKKKEYFCQTKIQVANTRSCVALKIQNKERRKERDREKDRKIENNFMCEQLHTLSFQNKLKEKKKSVFSIQVYLLIEYFKIKKVF